MRVTLSCSTTLVSYLDSRRAPTEVPQPRASLEGEVGHSEPGKVSGNACALCPRHNYLTTPGNNTLTSSGNACALCPRHSYLTTPGNNTLISSGNACASCSCSIPLTIPENNTLTSPCNACTPCSRQSSREQAKLTS